MKLNRPMIQAFTNIVKGIDTMEKLALAIHKSPNRTVEIVKDLENEGFVIKRINYSIKGSRKIIEIANTAHAIKLKELFFAYLGISFNDILVDSQLLFLAAVCEDWMTTSIASDLMGVSKYMIDRYRKKLKNRGFIVQKDKFYKINEKAWPLLKEFLISYKNYSTTNGQVKWKYDKEILFEVNDEDLIQGSVTGLYAYQNYGIKVRVISSLCYLPEKKLSKEEIFIHSLFQVNDPRTLHLALTFYLKNRLSYKKTLPLAMRYGKYTIFENMITLLKAKDNIKLEGLPEFDRKDFIRIARIYGVKNV